MDDELKQNDLELAKFELAKLVQFNEKAEAQAIYDYTNFLQSINTYNDLDDDLLDDLLDTISEIISDELNHQVKLHKLYEKIVAIKTNKE